MKTNRALDAVPKPVSAATASSANIGYFTWTTSSARSSAPEYQSKAFPVFSRPNWTSAAIIVAISPICSGVSSSVKSVTGVPPPYLCSNQRAASLFEGIRSEGRISG